MTTSAASDEANISPESSLRGISVVVPTRNRSHQLRRLLVSLDALVGRQPDEVIVVDGFSADDTGKVLEAWLAERHAFVPKVLRQNPPRGPGQARNQGAAAAEGDIVAFTDDDCRVHPRWLERLIPLIERGGRIVGAGGRVLPLRQDLVSRYYTFHRILDPPPSLLYLVSANCCYLRRPLLEVGGFDEDILRPGGEDIGVSFKLSRAGWKFALAEDAIVFHDYRGNILDFARTFRNYGRGCREVTEKHFSVPGVRS